MVCVLYLGGPFAFSRWWVPTSKCVDVWVDVGSSWTRCVAGVLPVCGV